MQLKRGINIGILLFLFVFVGLVSASPAYAATIYVNSSTGNDSSGTGSSGSPYKTFHKGYTSASNGDTLDLTGTFTWTDAAETGDSSTTGYTISKNLTIQGQSASDTILQSASADNTADRRVLTISAGYTVTLQKLTIRYGKTSDDAGGLLVRGTVTADKVAISYNRSTAGSGGGAQVEDGTLTLQNSTVNNNVAVYQGGGLHTDYYTNGTGTMHIINSTIVYNQITYTVATIGGGGVAYRGSGGTITNSTIAYNNIATGTAEGAGIFYYPRASTSLTIKNSIISQNYSGGVSLPSGEYDITKDSGTITDSGYNVIGKATSSDITLASTTWTDGTSSIDGTFTRPSGGSGSLGLATELADNSTQYGTQTLSINSSSIAIDSGSSSANGAIAIPSLDQRGLARSTPDIGAFEYGAVQDLTAPTITSISSNKANGSYKAGTVIDINVVFSEVVSSTGNITVTLETGDIDRTCTFTVSNASTGTCNYTVQAGDTSADLDASITGTITDQSGNVLSNFTPAATLASNKNLVIDTTPPSTPAANPAAGTYNSPQNITLSSTGSSAIYYTTDGSTPTTSSTLYSSAITVNTSLTLKALALDTATNTSTILTATYTINLDSTGPVISEVHATPGANSATITWTTDESASSQIEYGVTTNYGFTSSETNTSPRVTNHTYNLTGLLPCRRYYYRSKSSDAYANESTSTQGTFHTSGCVTSILSGNESNIATVSGGTISLTNSASSVLLTIPDGYSAESAYFQINKLSSTGVSAPSGLAIAAENIYDLSALTSSNSDLDTFHKPLTFTITYGEDVETNFSEDTLDIYRYNPTTSSWDKKNCTLNTSSNTLTCSLTSFSTYAILGTPRSSGNANTTSSVTTSNSTNCTSFAPNSAPNLFRIDTNKTTATVYFSPVLDSTKYYLSFSTHESAEEHGAELALSGEGVKSYTVESLSPSKRYYFKVRAQQDCMPGPWSQIQQATTESLLTALHTNQSTLIEELTAQKNNKITQAEEDMHASKNSYRVKVLVRNQKNRQPLKNTKIKVPELDQELTTDEQGEVIIESLPKGRYTFKLVGEAYAAEEVIDIDGENEEFNAVINVSVHEALLPNEAWIGIIASSILLTWVVMKMKQQFFGK